MLSALPSPLPDSDTVRTPLILAYDLIQVARARMENRKNIAFHISNTARRSLPLNAPLQLTILEETTDNILNANTVEISIKYGISEGSIYYVMQTVTKMPSLSAHVQYNSRSCNRISQILDERIIVQKILRS
jgi:hypothetical protein